MSPLPRRYAPPVGIAAPTTPYNRTSGIVSATFSAAMARYTRERKRCIFFACRTLWAALCTSGTQFGTMTMTATAYAPR